MPLARKENYIVLWSKPKIVHRRCMNSVKSEKSDKCRDCQKYSDEYKIKVWEKSS